jgi:hypothetical protein
MLSGMTLAEENAVRIDGGDRGSDNPVTGGSGGSNSGGNMTEEERKESTRTSN